MPNNSNAYINFLHKLESGEIRVAYKENDTWIINTEVKETILQIFRDSPIAEINDKSYVGYIDKELLQLRYFELKDDIRIAPGGTAVRRGAYVSNKVIIMPPSYINIGAYVDSGTMIDSHVLIGSCAQIGKNVHISASVQIGGVLEPVCNRPVIIEDNCFIGAGTVLTEGVLVREGAVVAQGVSISSSVPIYDIVKSKIYNSEIPENAVVMPGSRAISSDTWAKGQGLSLNCAVIVKYRDSKTDSSVALESALR